MYSSVVERLTADQQVPGSNPGAPSSHFCSQMLITQCRDNQCEQRSRLHEGSLAERSKALASGASPKGREFESHSCHLLAC